MRVQNDFFISGSEDGTVSLYSLQTNAFDRILLRSSLPIRDLALSPDRSWVAVASELEPNTKSCGHKLTRDQ